MSSPKKDHDREEFRKHLIWLGFSSYDAYMRSGPWMRLCDRFLSSKRTRVCAMCKKPGQELHHRNWQSMGKERPQDLVVLCGTDAATVRKARGDGDPSVIWEILAARTPQERRLAVRTWPRMGKVNLPSGKVGHGKNLTPIVEIGGKKYKAR